MRDFYGFSPDSVLEKPGILGISAGIIRRIFPGCRAYMLVSVYSKHS